MNAPFTADGFTADAEAEAVPACEFASDRGVRAEDPVEVLGISGQVIDRTAPGGVVEAAELETEAAAGAWQVDVDGVAGSGAEVLRLYFAAQLLLGEQVLHSALDE
ncbi:hypothetical protein [Streptomyces sp. NPDC003015]